MEINTHTLMLIALAMAASGGFVHVLISPYLSGEAKAQRRQSAIQAASSKRSSERIGDAAARRKQVAESLKEIEARGKRKHLSLEARIAQAGLAWSRTSFVAASALSAGLCTGLVWLAGGTLFIAMGAIAVGGVGIPLWTLNLLRKRRLAKFLNEFPNAIDVIIRGVKAGLPLGDCLRVIANESEEPVRSEFRQAIEAQAMGLSTSEAVERIGERVPVPEARFFAIVISIQQRAGGNLAEALGNLSAVLRDRKKIKGKIKAMSSESKASAYIIGSLPFLVSGAVYLTSPKYMELLWITDTGKLVMGGCAVWMGIGVFVMKSMINFDI